ncbi:MAG: oligosaccharide flippase family protein [Mucilaginibacter polytrichastri]|nr:oligosaccharide flippase family protein [Mucilaginibacter polytrichastri]
MIKNLLKNSAIYGLAPQLPRIAGIFCLPIITRHLTKIDFGVYSLVSAVVGGLAVFAHLGLNVILSNSYYKNPMRYTFVWRQIYGFLILWNIPFSILLAVFIYSFIPDDAAGNTFYILVLNVLPVVFFGPATIIGSLYYQLRQQPVQVAWRSITSGMISVGLNLYFIAGLEMGYMGWFLSVCISQMLLQLSYFISLTRVSGLTPIFNFKRRSIIHHLKISLPVIPHYYGSYLLDTSDRFIMKIVHIPIGDIGMYNVAYTIGNFVQAAGIAAGQAVSPMLLASYKESDAVRARQLVFLLQIMFLGACFVVSLWMKEVFEVLIKNEQLRHVYPSAIIIAMAYSYRPMYLGANNRLFYIEKTQSLLKITFIAGILNVILNLIFLKIYGYKAAAFTTYAGLMYMGYSGYFLKTYKTYANLPYYPLLWLLATLMLTVLAYFAVELPVVFKLVLSGLAVFTSFFLVQRIERIL